MYVLNEDRPTMDDITDPFPEPVLKLMRNCWAHSPEDRPTFEEANDILSTHLLPDQIATPKIKDSISEGGEEANQSEVEARLITRNVPTNEYTTRNSIQVPNQFKGELLVTLFVHPSWKMSDI